MIFGGSRKDDPGVYRCLRCGAPNAVMDDGFPVVIRMDNLPGVTALLTGELDEIRCQACHEPLDVHPVLGLVGSGNEAVACAPSAGSEDSGPGQGLVHALMEDGFNVARVASLDGMRAWLMRRWELRLPSIVDAWESDQGGTAEFMAVNLDAFDAEAFVFMSALASMDVPGFTGGIAPRNDSGSPATALATLQATSFLALCARWSADGVPQVERDLCRFVPVGGLLPGAAGPAVQILMGILDQELSQVLAYSGNALLATICFEAELPNPRADAWATAWMRHEVLLAVSEFAASQSTLAEGVSRPALEVLRACRVEQGRARRTLDRRMLHNAAVGLLAENDGLFKYVVEAGVRAGLENFGVELTGAGRMEGTQALLPDDFLKALAPFAENRSPSAILSAADQLVRHISDLTPQQVWGLTDTMAGWWPESPEAAAECEIWAGSVLSRLRASAEFLSRVGEVPRPSEATLPLEYRHALQWERAEALLGTGRPEAAKTLLSQLLAKLPADLAEAPDLRIRRSLGNALRQVGEAEEAVELLRSVRLAGGVGERLETLHALANAEIALGRLDEALVAIDEARQLADGPYRAWAATTDAVRANLLVSLQRPTEAETALRAVSIERLNDPAVLVPYVSALVSYPALLNTAEGRQMAAGALQHLNFMLPGQDSKHITEPDQQALRLTAILSDLTGSSGAGALWGMLAQLSDSAGHPDPMAVLAVAAESVSTGDPRQARESLDRAFEVLSTSYSGNRLLSRSYLSTRSLWGFTERVQTKVGRAGLSAQYQRVASELGRDVVGRVSVAARRTTGERLQLAAPWDDVITLCPWPVAVVEWLGTAEALRPLITFIRDGRVSSILADPSPVDVGRLTRRITARLDNWLIGRDGDPFDSPLWEEAAGWLRSQIAVHASTDATVVLVEHRIATRVPWHVATTPIWPTVSVPSWSSLITEFRSDTPAIGRIGCVTVPRFGEDPEIETAFGGVMSALLQLEAPGRTVEIVQGRDADRSQLGRILGSTDLCVLLCHGYASRFEPTVAWLLAHEQSLPLAGSVAGASPTGRRHQFTWDDCDRLPSASAMVVSAACKTAVSHTAGGGEQLGLYSALRRHGTRSLVAPRWDIPAAVTLPVFTDVIKRIVTDGLSPASAAQAASIAAARNLPPWLAYAPAVAGSWSAISANQKDKDRRQRGEL